MEEEKSNKFNFNYQRIISNLLPRYHFHYFNSPEWKDKKNYCSTIIEMGLNFIDTAKTYGILKTREKTQETTTRIKRQRRTCFILN